MDFFCSWLEGIDAFLIGVSRQDVVRLVVTSFSVLLGATLAYANQNRIEKNKKQIENINACQQALFFLGQLQENLHDIQQELEDFRDLDNRHIALPKIIHGQEKIDFESSTLTFLLFGKEPNLVYQLAMMEREYYKLISLKNRRNELVNHISRDRSLTPVEEELCKRYTDKLYHQFERCHIFNNQIMKEALNIFKEKFKKSNFVVGVTNVINR